MTPVVVRICRETKQPELFFYNQTVDGRDVWLECYTKLEGDVSACVEYMRNKTYTPKTESEAKAADDLYRFWLYVYNTCEANNPRRKRLMRP